MAGNDASTKFYDALNESYDTLIDAIRAANDRGHRISASLIEDAQRGQREAVEMGKKWMEAPLDASVFFSTLLETTTKAQARALEVTRQWFNEAGEAQQETREIFQRMLSANRGAGEAAVDLARSAATRTGELIRTAGESVTAAAVSDGRAPQPKTAQAAEPVASETEATSEA